MRSKAEKVEKHANLGLEAEAEEDCRGRPSLAFDGQSEGLTEKNASEWRHDNCQLSRQLNTLACNASFNITPNGFIFFMFLLSRDR